MQSVVFLDDAEVALDDLVDALETHGVVVLDSMFRGPARVLRDQAVNAMQLNNEEEVINHCELEVFVGGELSYVTTFFYSGKHLFHHQRSQCLVERAMAEWVAKGQPRYYVFRDRVRAYGKH
ncbi:hypothetical protein BZL41_09975 [Pseudomonas sp. PIC25]|uniref:hypothetical protein n=1 Tax=Pseudomonas sp. PIC25 TaxID=1958773 RepID=UPI000BABFD7B|nr:hypothetical protein [Pseudomonas sp. PIC25]PAU64430.1 hypothetical protein BZL41_09975 [Pseudomonas sp. PIC25]